MARFPAAQAVNSSTNAFSALAHLDEGDYDSRHSSEDGQIASSTEPYSALAETGTGSIATIVTMEVSDVDTKTVEDDLILLEGPRKTDFSLGNDLIELDEQSLDWLANRQPSLRPSQTSATQELDLLDYDPSENSAPISTCRLPIEPLFEPPRPSLLDEDGEVNNLLVTNELRAVKQGRKPTLLAMKQQRPVLDKEEVILSWDKPAPPQEDPSAVLEEFLDRVSGKVDKTSIKKERPSTSKRRVGAVRPTAPVSSPRTSSRVGVNALVRQQQSRYEPQLKVTNIQAQPRPQGVSRATANQGFKREVTSQHVKREVVQNNVRGGTLAQQKIQGQILSNQPARARYGRLAAKNSAKPVSPHPRNKLAPQNIIEPDNKAVLAYKNGQPPVKTFKLPRGFNPTGLGGRAGMSTNFPRLHMIANETETFIVPNVRRAGDAPYLCFWGTDGQIESAIQLIKTWIADVQDEPVASSKKWAKIRSLSEKQILRIKKKLQKEAMQQAFRQLKPPHDGSTCSSRSEISWPSDMDIRPEQVLGKSFEAFDAIRMDCQCYIFPVRHGSELKIIVLGNDPERFAIAVQRVYVTIFQIQSRSFTPPEYFLIKVSSKHALRQKVRLIPHFDPKLRDADENVLEPTGQSLVLCGPPVDVEEQEWRQMPQALGCEDEVKAEPIVLEKRNLLIVEAVVMATLEKLVYHRGNIQMRAKLGRFVLTNYKKPDSNMQYDLGELEEMLDEYNREESPMQAKVTPELGEKELENQLLSRFMDAEETLRPADPTVHGLAEVKPTFTAMFVVGNVEKESGDYVLEIEYKEGVGGVDAFDIVSSRWSRLDLGKEDKTSVMEINMVDIEERSTFQLAINSAYVVDESRLARSYQKFAETIQFTLEEARVASGDRAFVKPLWWHLPPGTSLKAASQKRSWKFGFKDSEYIAEVSSIQKINARGPIGGEMQYTPYELRWSVNVLHPSWDLEFAMNAEMGIGEKADWMRSEGTFFPPGKNNPVPAMAGDGLIELVRKLEDLDMIIRGPISQGTTASSDFAEMSNTIELSTPAPQAVSSQTMANQPQSQQSPSNIGYTLAPESAPLSNQNSSLGLLIESRAVEDAVDEMFGYTKYPRRIPKSVQGVYKDISVAAPTTRSSIKKLPPGRSRNPAFKTMLATQTTRPPPGLSCSPGLSPNGSVQAMPPPGLQFPFTYGQHVPVNQQPKGPVRNRRDSIISTTTINPDADGFIRYTFPPPIDPEATEKRHLVKK